MQIICICTYLWASVRPVLCFYIDICMQTNEEAYRHAHILKCKYICIHMCVHIYCLFIYIYIWPHIYLYIYHSTAISGRSAVTLKASCIYLYTYTHLQYVLIYLFSFVIYIYLLITYFLMHCIQGYIRICKYDHNHTQTSSHIHRTGTSITGCGTGVAFGPPL